MAGLEPFTPDDVYCVYCNAQAAGVCAECGALCCADCVELVMGWTTQRAVCSPCLRQENASPIGRIRSPRWRIAMIVVALAAAAAFLATL